MVLPKEDQDLDLSAIGKKLEGNIGMSLKQTRLSLAFPLESETQVILLQSGICIIEGLLESDNALAEYHRIVDNLE